VVKLIREAIRPLAGFDLISLIISDYFYSLIEMLEEEEKIGEKHQLVESCMRSLLLLASSTLLHAKGSSSQPTNEEESDEVVDDLDPQVI